MRDQNYFIANSLLNYKSNIIIPAICFVKKKYRKEKITDENELINAFNIFRNKIYYGTKNDGTVYKENVLYCELFGEPIVFLFNNIKNENKLRDFVKLIDNLLLNHDETVSIKDIQNCFKSKKSIDQITKLINECIGSQDMKCISYINNITKVDIIERYNLYNIYKYTSRKLFENDNSNSITFISGNIRFNNSNIRIETNNITNAFDELNLNNLDTTLRYNRDCIKCCDCCFDSYCKCFYHNCINIIFIIIGLLLNIGTYIFEVTNNYYTYFNNIKTFPITNFIISITTSIYPLIFVNSRKSGFIIMIIQVITLSMLIVVRIFNWINNYICIEGLVNLLMSFIYIIIMSIVNVHNTKSYQKVKYCST